MLQIHLCKIFYIPEVSRANKDRFVKILVIEIFSSILGLFGLIIGLLVQSNAPEFE